VTVINSTNINKTNNRISPLLIEHLKKKLRHITLEIKVLDGTGTKKWQG